MPPDLYVTVPQCTAFSSPEDPFFPPATLTEKICENLIVNKYLLMRWSESHLSVRCCPEHKLSSCATCLNTTMATIYVLYGGSHILIHCFVLVFARSVIHFWSQLWAICEPKSPVAAQIVVLKTLNSQSFRWFLIRPQAKICIKCLAAKFVILGREPRLISLKAIRQNY